MEKEKIINELKNYEIERYKEKIGIIEEGEIVTDEDLYKEEE